MQGWVRQLVDGRDRAGGGLWDLGRFNPRRQGRIGDTGGIEGTKIAGRVAASVTAGGDDASNLRSCFRGHAKAVVGDRFRGAVALC